ncbi:hypothetical protein ACHAWF_002559, partial [Thalassiosira exigua]
EDAEDEGWNASFVETIPPNANGARASNIFCFATLAGKHTGTIYTDCTDHLPAVSLEENYYFLIAYNYDNNYIFARPMKDVKDSAVGYKPTFHVTDNQTTKPLKEFLRTKDCEWQFVEPNNHRVNATERAIQTFKNHLIRGFCCMDPNWPFQLWDHLTAQAEITVNLLRCSRRDPSKSSYHSLHGHRYNWDAHPFVPPGTKAVAYEDATSRASRAPRGIDAWYCGLAMDHYRCRHFYVPETRGLHVSWTYELHPHHCLLL